MLGPGLPNLKKVNNLATGVNLLTMFVTLIPNEGPRVLQKGPREGVICLQISEMYDLNFYHYNTGLKPSFM